MRRAVIKVQDEPISTASSLKENIQNLCGQTLGVNLDDDDDDESVYVEDNPKLRIYGTGCILLHKEFEIIMEK